MEPKTTELPQGEKPIEKDLSLSSPVHKKLRSVKKSIQSDTDDNVIIDGQKGNRVSFSGMNDDLQGEKRLENRISQAKSLAFLQEKQPSIETSKLNDLQKDLPTKMKNLVCFPFFNLISKDQPIANAVIQRPFHSGFRCPVTDTDKRIGVSSYQGNS